MLHHVVYGCDGMTADLTLIQQLQNVTQKGHKQKGQAKRSYKRVTCKGHKGHTKRSQTKGAHKKVMKAELTWTKRNTEALHRRLVKVFMGLPYL